MEIDNTFIKNLFHSTIIKVEKGNPIPLGNHFFFINNGKVSGKMGAKKNTAPLRDTGSDPTGFDLQRDIKSQCIEKKQPLSINSFSEDISKKSVSIKMKQHFNALVKNTIPQLSKLEKNFNNRILTVSSKEKIPLHARLYLNSWEKKVEKIIVSVKSLFHSKNLDDNGY